jgi:hypothetical protein
MDLAHDAEVLIMVRENAEQIVAAVEIALKAPGPFDGPPMTAEVRAEYEREGQQAENQRRGHVYADITDEDLPF